MWLVCVCLWVCVCVCVCVCESVCVRACVHVFMLCALNLGKNVFVKKCRGPCGLGVLSIHYYYYYYTNAGLTPWYSKKKMVPFPEWTFGTDSPPMSIQPHGATACIKLLTSVHMLKIASIHTIVWRFLDMKIQYTLVQPLKVESIYPGRRETENGHIYYMYHTLCLLKNRGTISITREKQKEEKRKEKRAPVNDRPKLQKYVNLN